MLAMKPETRLILSAILIVGSAGYGVLLHEAPKLAEAVALGYIAALLTIITAINLWKRS